MIVAIAPLYTSILNFALAIIGWIIWHRWGYGKPNRQAYAFPIVVWIVHVIVLEGFIILQTLGIWSPLTTQFLALWSFVVRFHAVFTLVGIGIILVRGRRKIEL